MASDAQKLWNEERRALLAKYGEAILKVGQLAADLETAKAQAASLERDLHALGVTAQLARHLDQKRAIPESSETP